MNSDRTPIVPSVAAVPVIVETSADSHVWSPVTIVPMTAAISGGRAVFVSAPWRAVIAAWTACRTWAT